MPVLWTSKHKTIVSNESAEIIQYVNTAFDHLTGNTEDYYPEALHETIDTLNERIYETINNGVYWAGFEQRRRQPGRGFSPHSIH